MKINKTNVKLKNVISFTYIGSKINSDGKNYHRYKLHRHSLKKNFLFTSKTLNIIIRKIIRKTVVWSIGSII